MKTQKNPKAKTLNFKRVCIFLMNIVLFIFFSLYSEVATAENKVSKIKDTAQINLSTILNEVSEDEIKLEYWMTNTISFGEKVLPDNVKDQTKLNMEDTIVEEMEVELWMTELNIFNEPVKIHALENEGDLEVQKWMLDMHTFQSKCNLAQAE